MENALADMNYSLAMLVSATMRCYSNPMKLRSPNRQPSQLPGTLMMHYLCKKNLFIAGTLVDTNACDSDSAQSIGKVPERRLICGTGPPQIDTEPRTFFQVWQEDIRRPDLMSLEEFTRNSQGYQYVICHSGYFEDQQPSLRGNVLFRDMTSLSSMSNLLLFPFLCFAGITAGLESPAEQLRTLH